MCDGKIYLDEAGVLKYLVGITNEFELLHYSHGLIQIQDDSCGCDAEISLQRNMLSRHDLQNTKLFGTVSVSQ